MFTIAQACREHLREGSRIVLGLSGGRDSVALLHLLHEQGCIVYARHMHHGIRAEAADADAHFCQQLCARLGVDYAEEHADIPSLVKASGESLELCARQERRLYLLEEARRTGAGAIALAQHADDQAETVLFRMARGAAGPRAMQPCSRYQGCLLLRPLLQTRRAEITHYLQSKGEAWRDDASNESRSHTRNALRHDVLPAYAQAMGRDIVPILNRSARVQAEVADALQEAIELLHPHFYDPQGRLYLPALQQAGVGLRRAVLMSYLQNQCIPQPSSQLIEQIEELLEPQSRKSRVNLAGGRQICRRQQRLFVN